MLLIDTEQKSQDQTCICLGHYGSRMFRLYLHADISLQFLFHEVAQLKCILLNARFETRYNQSCEETTARRYRREIHGAYWHEQVLGLIWRGLF